MKDTIIDIYNASQDDRIKLHNHLNALGEEIYSDTGLKNRYYSCSKFEYDSGSNFWSGSGVSKDLSAISITDFIKKFPVKHQYKPGDLVKIRSDLRKSSIYDIYVNVSMAKLAGKTIALVSLRGRTSKSGKPLWKVDDKKIIDDVLAGVKLPAGILDTDEE